MSNCVLWTIMVFGVSGEVTELLDLKSQRTLRLSNFFGFKGGPALKILRQKERWFLSTLVIMAW